MSAPRPFDLDPEVMAAIRPMDFADAGAVAHLHSAAMGTSLWSRLGEGFLTRLYVALLGDPRFIGFVYLEDGEIRGFIAGSEDVPAMYRRTLRRAGPRLALGALRGVAREPGLLRPLLQTAAYFRASSVDPETEGITTESLFCSFAPHLRGKRISGHINKVLFDELAARGHTHVKITTETTNEGAVRQLESWGFTRKGTFLYYGKEMVAYVLDLGASPRVTPVRRHHPPR